MDQSLGYLREILSGHTGQDAVGKRLYARLSKKNYPDETAFVDELTAEENDYLNNILKEAIDYSDQEKDYERSKQLNEVYELLMTY
ncbi:sigma-G-dependent sporulation-specific acid-soluble spore protein CsgA [Peribacillus kribbensis]|uniref:sigma-G-dependent sporulation-specific acid-soluble spore protein CsgA n=1 Tax=Peribacillus kribbensis TaxID=356658 RepID=UPI0003F61AED|nr:sigma-G-dependent sporulation-specific acid-soluble spore protein CsgA [Peribacillus kribbensis]